MAGIEERGLGLGLDWLDETETTNLSYEDVISELSFDGLFEEWRYSNGLEFNELIANYLIVPLGNCQYFFDS